MRFAHRLVAMLFKGDSHLDRAVRAATALVSLGIFVFFQDKLAVQVSIPSGPILMFDLPIGGVIVGIVAVLFVLPTAGAAWVQSRGAVLRMADVLEWDPQHQHFRLRVWNDGGNSAEPKVSVTRIVNGTNDPVMRFLLPIELGWSHEAAGSRATLSRHDSEGKLVSFLWVAGTQTSLGHSPPPHLVITGLNTRLTVDDPLGVGKRSLWFLVEAEADHAEVRRWFALHPDSSLGLTDGLGYRAVNEMPPTVVPSLWQRLRTSVIPRGWRFRRQSRRDAPRRLP